MNKIVTAALVAGGLLLLNAPEASAHDEIRVSYERGHYYGDVRRHHRMPYWLKRDKAFRRWYKKTRLRRYEHLTWHRLFNIYRWETIERRKHRRVDRYARNHHYYRHHDRDERRGRRH